MGNTENKTIVGVPFYDQEGLEVLEACISNVDSCLNNLGVDAKIVVGINGPRVSMGLQPLAWMVDTSKYNSDIEFIKTRPGIVAAEKAICTKAQEEGYKRIFLTDADISRLPNSLDHMWSQGDCPVVGANYCAYPPEILSQADVQLTKQQITLMSIFEADKHPQAREFTWPHRPEKRIKGSLLLVDTDIVSTMFGYQGITSDSRMNSNIAVDKIQIVSDASFMHYARIDIIDHVQARIRHFRAANAENQLESFYRKSIIYSPENADEIAKKIVEKDPTSKIAASNFLLQCALRHQVADICKSVVSKKNYIQDYDQVDSTSVLTTVVNSFSEAMTVMANVLSCIDWNCLNTPEANGKGTTQNNLPRKPIDLEPFLAINEYRELITRHLGLPVSVNV